MLGPRLDPPRLKLAPFGLVRLTIVFSSCSATAPLGTSAIEWGELVDLSSFYVTALRRLGSCVGTLWIGVVEGLPQTESEKAMAGLSHGSPLTISILQSSAQVFC